MAKAKAMLNATAVADTATLQKTAGAKGNAKAKERMGTAMAPTQYKTETTGMEQQVLQLTTAYVGSPLMKTEAQRKLTKRWQDRLNPIQAPNPATSSRHWRGWGKKKSTHRIRKAVSLHQAVSWHTKEAATRDGAASNGLPTTSFLKCITSRHAAVKMNVVVVEIEQ